MVLSNRHVIHEEYDWPEYNRTLEFESGEWLRVAIHISKLVMSCSRIAFHTSKNRSQSRVECVTSADELNRRQHSRSIDRCVSQDHWALEFPLVSVALRILIWTVVDSISFFFLEYMVMIHREAVAASLKTISEMHFEERLASIVSHCLRKRSRSELHQFSDSEKQSVQRNSLLSLVHSYWFSGLSSIVGS